MNIKSHWSSTETLLLDIEFTQNFKYMGEKIQKIRKCRHCNWENSRQGNAVVANLTMQDLVCLQKLINEYFIIDPVKCYSCGLCDSVQRSFRIGFHLFIETEFLYYQMKSIFLQFYQMYLWF